MKKLIRNFRKYLTEGQVEDYDENGMMTLYHFSEAQDDSMVLDPEYFLSNRKSFTRNDFQASNLPRIFFYVNLDHAENIVKQGRTLYSTVVDASKVYDMAKDPMGFKDEARNWPRNIYGEPIKTAPAPLNMDLLLRGVADNFPGAFYETSTMDVVVWFEPIEVYRVKEKEEE